MRPLREPRRRLASRRQAPLRHLRRLHSRTATLSQQPLVAQLLLRRFPTTRPGRMPITQSRKMVLLVVILLPMLPKVARFEYCRTEGSPQFCFYAFVCAAAGRPESKMRNSYTRSISLLYYLPASISMGHTFYCSNALVNSLNYVILQ